MVVVVVVVVVVVPAALLSDRPTPGSPRREHCSAGGFHFQASATQPVLKSHGFGSPWKFTMHARGGGPPSQRSRLYDTIAS